MQASTSTTLIASSSFLSTILIMYRIRLRYPKLPSLSKKVSSVSSTSGVAVSDQRPQAPVPPAEKKYGSSLIQLTVPTTGFHGMATMFSNDLIIAKCVKGVYSS